MKLNQCIAVEKGIKNRTQNEITIAYHMAQKTVLFTGFTKTYRPKAEGDETFPPESKLVEVKVSSLVRQVRKNMAELFDITATKDFANCKAKADVVVDGVVLAKEVPATYLLFLEKQLTDLATFVGKLPTLSADAKWIYDNNSEVYKTEPTQTVKTKKVQEALLLIAPTDKHPGQAAQITVDKLVGTWDNVDMSGAINEPDKRSLLDKVEKLMRAVKFAREEANLVDTQEINVSEKLLGYLFDKQPGVTTS